MEMQMEMEIHFHLYFLRLMYPFDGDARSGEKLTVDRFIVFSIFYITNHQIKYYEYCFSEA